MRWLRIADFGSRLANHLPLLRRSMPHSALNAKHSSLVDGEFLLKLDRLTLSIGRDLVSGLMGEHSAVRRTAGIEFADYRQYSLGDDIRRVDWNAYARLGTLHIRQAQAEHDSRLYILLDASPSMNFGAPTKLYAAKRLAAALGYIALAHLDSVTLAVPGVDEGRWTTDDSQEGSPQKAEGSNLSTKYEVRNTQYRGRAEAPNLFRYLQDLPVVAASNFDSVLGSWGTGHGQGRVAIVISDLLLDGYQAGLRQMVGMGFQVTLLHLLSQGELHPPDAGDMEFVDSETGQELQVHLGHESLAEYNRRLEAWLADSEAWCRSSGVNYIRIESDWDIERVLLETLKRHGVTV